MSESVIDLTGPFRSALHEEPSSKINLAGPFLQALREQDRVENEVSTYQLLIQTDANPAVISEALAAYLFAATHIDGDYVSAEILENLSESDDTWAQREWVLEKPGSKCVLQTISDKHGIQRFGLPVDDGGKQAVIFSFTRPLTDEELTWIKQQLPEFAAAYHTALAATKDRPESVEYTPIAFYEIKQLKTVTQTTTQTTVQSIA